MSRPLMIALVLLAAFGSSGCYYSHLASGQLALVWNRRPIDEALLDPALDPQTRRLLGLVGSVRVFAQDLGLRVGEQYTQYVEWPGDRVVTTIVRTKAAEGTLEPTPFWFPFVGRLPYKGYFDRERAESEAERLRAQSFDVCLTGVSAYSTLGWIDDPVTSPMLQQGAASLVETILHELVHATAFVPDEIDFNESVAHFIGQEAAVRFFRALETSSPGADAWPDGQRVRDLVEDRRAVARVTLDFRERLQALADVPHRERWRPASEIRARVRLASLPLRVVDPERVARRARLSDACLALRGTYTRDLPRHARVLEALGDDLRAMIARLAAWAEEERPVEQFYSIGAEGDSSR